jgi:Uma2 family endonuclease
MSTLPNSSTGSDLTWEIARLFPPQGHWTVEEYLRITDSARQLIEYVDGRLEFLTMPTGDHQFMARFLLDQLRGFVEPKNLGEVLFSPLRVYCSEKIFREPDLVFKFHSNMTEADRRYFHGADLVMEIVSDDPESYERDYVAKVADYAAAGIPEYWIIDPQDRKITVLALTDGKYTEHSVATVGEVAESRLLPGFQVDVDAVLAAGGIK